jgi:type II secretory pathway pseudopilin PulG
LKNYLKQNNAFTFVETLAALVILSAALVPILVWVPTSIQTKLKTERKTVAILLAQRKLEESRFKIIKNFSVDYNEDSVAYATPFQDFRYTITDNLGTSIKTISAKVWNIEKPEDDATFYTQVAKR